jgi:nucleotide-binding universal stress UspA family protein
MADIVVGYDGSEHAKAAVATAVDFARGLGDRVVVVFGYEPSPLGGESADLRAALEETGRKLLTEASSSIDHEGVELEALLVDERPEEALIRIGNERSARCLVVGTRGEGPVTAAILGSVSHKLLRMAKRPVLVVPTD